MKRRNVPQRKSGWCQLVVFAVVERTILLAAPIDAINVSGLGGLAVELCLSELAIPFETSVSELLAVESERDENVSGYCGRYACDGCRTELRETGEGNLVEQSSEPGVGVEISGVHVVQNDVDDKREGGYHGDMALSCTLFGF